MSVVFIVVLVIASLFMFGRIFIGHTERFAALEPKPLKSLDMTCFVETGFQDRDHSQKFVGKFDVHDGVITAYDLDGTRLVGWPTAYNFLVLGKSGFVRADLPSGVYCFEQGIRIGGAFLHVMPCGVKQGDELATQWIIRFVSYRVEYSGRTDELMYVCMTTGEIPSFRPRIKQSGW